MRRFLLFLSAILLFTACKGGVDAGQASASAKRYQLKGKVISVDRTAKKAKIEHEDVEGYMEGMTMDFPIHADWVWNDLTPGSEIRADLVVDNAAKDPFYLENVGIVALPNPDQSPLPQDDKFAKLVGEAIPDFSLTNQDGKRISLKDFRGKALAITFIYAKCPLPDYCIRMSTNFSDLARQIAADDNIKDKIRLLSISFDPANDTPAKLRSYGIGYLGNDPNAKFDVWQLAAGSDAEVRKIAEFFGMAYQVDEQDKARINHNLRTAVIGPDGKVTKVFPGNEWTTSQLLKELEAALAGPSVK
jgi:protein SCO1/2